MTFRIRVAFQFLLVLPVVFGLHVSDSRRVIGACVTVLQHLRYCFLSRQAFCRHDCFKVNGGALPLKLGLENLSGDDVYSHQAALPNLRPIKSANRCAEVFAFVVCNQSGKPRTYSEVSDKVIARRSPSAVA